jgi:hypothetical protein
VYGPVKVAIGEGGKMNTVVIVDIPTGSCVYVTVSDPGTKPPVTVVRVPYVGSVGMFEGTATTTVPVAPEELGAYVIVVGPTRPALVDVTVI